MSVFSDIIEGWRLILTRRNNGPVDEASSNMAQAAMEAMIAATHLDVDETDPIDVTVMLERGDSGQFTVESPQIAFVGDTAPETATPISRTAWLPTSVNLWHTTGAIPPGFLEDFVPPASMNIDDYIPNLARLMGITEDEVRQRLFPERTGNEPMLGGDKRQDGAA